MSFNLRSFFNRLPFNRIFFRGTIATRPQMVSVSLTTRTVTLTQTQRIPALSVAGRITDITITTRSAIESISRREITLGVTN